MIQVSLRLLVNFLRGLLLSGLDTARIIVVDRHRVQSGLVELPYRGLSATQASVVGALITLAPGSTTVEIDTRGQRFVLHLLDISDSDRVLQGIQRDFIDPLNKMNGGKP
jgi:multisubunit Na+/H+ antiporter MnhE subunit